MRHANTRRRGQERLRAVAGMVPRGAIVADLGSGHGILPRLLLVTGRAERCVATERDERALQQTLRFPAGHPLSGSLEFRTGDGLLALRPGDGIEVVTLTGLGGRSIARILGDPRASRLALRRVVLQPQAQWAELRRWLVEHGWRIVDERLPRERGRSYLVIAAEPDRHATSLTHPTLTRDELLEAGPCLVLSRDPEVSRFWHRELERHERILRRIPPGPGSDEVRRQRDLALRVLGTLPTAEF